jgi:zinc transport system ATP-binding protein
MITSVSSGKTSPTSEPPLHATKPLLDVDDLTVRFGSETVLEHMSFCVHPGEFIGLIGPNGAGKTTLLRTVLGLMQPTAGHVRREQARIGYIPQRGTLYNGTVPISVLEAVRLGAGGSTPAAQKALAQVGLGRLAGRRFNELSGGQQQRVALAKALSGGADVLILDEPTTGVDEQTQTTFYELLRSLQQQGVTIIMVSHEVDTVLKLVTRVICLNGTIVYDGPPEHFEADTYMPSAYANQHVQLHHHYEGHHA